MLKKIKYVRFSSLANQLVADLQQLIMAQLSPKALWTQSMHEARKKREALVPKSEPAATPLLATSSGTEGDMARQVLVFPVSILLPTLEHTWRLH